jgi:hypothetical protein
MAAMGFRSNRAGGRRSYGITCGTATIAPEGGAPTPCAVGAAPWPRWHAMTIAPKVGAPTNNSL